MYLDLNSSHPAEQIKQCNTAEIPSLRVTTAFRTGCRCACFTGSR